MPVLGSAKYYLPLLGTGTQQHFHHFASYIFVFLYVSCFVVILGVSSECGGRWGDRNEDPFRWAAAQYRYSDEETAVPEVL